VNEITHRVEIERGYLLEKSLGFSLKPPSFAGSGIGPKRPQRILRGPRFGDHVLVQVATEDPADFWKR
jgi:hypothetical protein